MAPSVDLVLVWFEELIVCLLLQIITFCLNPFTLAATPFGAEHDAMADGTLCGQGLLYATIETLLGLGL